VEELTFSRRSRRAIILFVILLIVFAIIPRIVIYYTPEKPLHFSWKEKEIIDNFKPITYQSKFKKYSKKEYKIPDQKFDPNRYTVSEWMNLGLSQKQALVVLKFGKYGFNSKEDLKKVFVIPKELMDKIIDSTFYPEKSKTYLIKDFPKEKKVEIVNLNLATEEDLLKINGIGPFFAKNIIKRRDQLGGFINENQLEEVWKMTPEKIVELQPFLLIDPQQIQKLNINTASAEDLIKHPYFTWNIANSIVKLRNQHGPFKSINDLKMSVVLTEELFLKIKPYLTL
jgi:competence protein ComEA